jgi:hypothetical protein
LLPPLAVVLPGSAAPGSRHEVHVARRGGALDGVHALVHVEPQVVGAQLAAPCVAFTRRGR